MTSSRADGGFLGFLLLFTLAMGAFLLLPGLLLTFAAADALGIPLDTGQLWIFGGTVGGGLLFAGWLLRGPAFALSSYACACLFAGWVMAFAHWGLKAEWPLELASKAIPGIRG